MGEIADYFFDDAYEIINEKDSFRDDIKIVNKKTYVKQNLPYEIYIGRPAPLGNPFTIPPYDRKNSIKHFEKYFVQILRSDILKTNIEQTVYREFLRCVGLYKEHGRLILICYCTPKACHGEIIKREIEKICMEK